MLGLNAMGPFPSPTRGRRELGVYPQISIYHLLRTTLWNSLNALPCSVGRVCTFFCVEEVLREKATGASRRQALGTLCGGDMGRSPAYPLWMWL